MNGLRAASEPVDRSEVVANELWFRVRRLAARLALLEEAERREGLDEDGRDRLRALRLRCSRAIARAQLADELADRIAAARATQRAG